MHHPHDQGQWVKSLKEHAAHMAFPDWQPTSDDWTHLYTGHDDGARYTEVAVYRPSEGGHDRIYYQRYSGDELMAFWTRLVNQISE